MNCTLQLQKEEKEAALKPVTPSKIPVGNFRVEEEKAINRAITGAPMNGSLDSNRRSSESNNSIVSPGSKIPKISVKLGTHYRKVQVNMLSEASQHFRTV